MRMKRKMAVETVRREVRSEPSEGRLPVLATRTKRKRRIGIGAKPTRARTDKVKGEEPDEPKIAGLSESPHLKNG